MSIDYCIKLTVNLHIFLQTYKIGQVGITSQESNCPTKEGKKKKKQSWLTELQHKSNTKRIDRYDLKVGIGLSQAYFKEPEHNRPTRELVRKMNN